MKGGRRLILFGNRTRNKHLIIVYDVNDLMASIGPELPSHLQQRLEEAEPAVGPQIPSELLNTQTADADDEDEDDYVPELPPDLKTIRSATPSVSTVVRTVSYEEKRVSGPSLPSYPPIYDPKYHAAYNEDDDDDDFGPKPLPAGVKHAETNAVQEFMEREERRRKVAEVSGATSRYVLFLHILPGSGKTENSEKRRMDASSAFVVRSARK